MLSTFLSEITTQSKTALSLGTRLIVFSGRSTLNSFRDLSFWPVGVPLQNDIALVTSIPVWHQCQSRILTPVCDRKRWGHSSRQWCPWSSRSPSNRHQGGGQNPDRSSEMCTIGSFKERIKVWSVISPLMCTPLWRWRWRSNPPPRGSHFALTSHRPDPRMPERSSSGRSQTWWTCRTASWWQSNGWNALVWKRRSSLVRNELIWI